ncbi:MAG: hypothetical protein C0621_09580 [Desulfuromonas sp.]|nr:MAG: hypothetical protein C0621_09580 [Desulfuromonas sp.]
MKINLSGGGQVCHGKKENVTWLSILSLQKCIKEDFEVFMQGLFSLFIVGGVFLRFKGWDMSNFCAESNGFVPIFAET